MLSETDDNQLRKDVEESMAKIEEMMPGFSERILAIVVDVTQAVIEQVRGEMVTGGCQFVSLLDGKYEDLDSLIADIRDGLDEILDSVECSVEEALGIDYLDVLYEVRELATAKSNLMVNEELRTSGF